MNILISNGADINAIDEDGFTVLKYAEDDGNEEVVKYMKNLQRKVSEFTKSCAKNYHPPNSVREDTVIISDGGWRGTHKSYILTNDDGEDKSISKEEYDEFNNNKKDKTKIISDLLTNLNKLKTLL